MTEQKKRVPLTFMLFDEDKEKLKKLAYTLGLRRNESGRKVANVSELLNMLILYLFEEKDHFKQWMEAKIDLGLEIEVDPVSE